MPKILIAIPYSPWPVNTGGKSRQFNLITRLAERGYSVTLLVQSKNDVSAMERQVLAGVADRVFIIPRRPLRHWRSLFYSTFSPLPVLASVNSYSPALEQTFRELMKEAWDVVQVEHSYAAQPFLGELRRRGVPFVVTEHNVESQLGAATYEKWPRVLRAFASLDRMRARRWERQVLASAASVVAVTQQDADQLSQLSGRQASVVENGVDAKRFRQVRANSGSTRLMFLGNYEYRPNVDAVEWAASEIMPRVWKENPAITLSVCGFGLNESMRRRFTDKRIEWQGFVSNIQAMQASSFAFLAPLRQGGGSKLKVLEAMAAGLPLISTAQGVSGLALVKGRDALVAESADALASSVLRIAQDPILAAEMGERGRRYVSEHHDWDRCTDQLEAVYRSHITHCIGDAVMGAAQ